MAQHDYVIDDQNGLNFLADLNANLAAIVSQNSGATEPATTYAYQFWADTTAGVLKLRNAADNAWIDILTLSNGVPSDAELTAIAGLTSAANKVPMFSGSGTAMLLDFKDEDDMSSDSATAVPSQQSVKAYVDTNAALPSQTGNANKILRTNGTTVSWDSQITLGTSVASTSGTAIDFTSIPDGVKRITVMFSGVSTSGTSSIIVQIGSGSFLTSGYNGSGNNGPNAAVSFTTGFGAVVNVPSANSVGGDMKISNVTGNTWSATASFGGSGSNHQHAAGNVSLSDTLTQLRITTVNGTDTFDAGSINISCEF